MRSTNPKAELELEARSMAVSFGICPQKLDWVRWKGPSVPLTFLLMLMDGKKTHQGLESEHLHCQIRPVSFQTQ